MIHTFTYLPQGVCSRKMAFAIDDDDTIKDFEVIGGCNGNLAGIRKLITGMTCQSVIEKLQGTKCGFKDTSCPDQIAQALSKYLSEKENA